MSTFIHRHSVATYFTLTFAISWGAAFLAVGGTGGMQGTAPESDPRFAYALIAMLAGPSISGLLATALVSGRTGLRLYTSRLLEWRADATTYTVAVLIAPLVMTATLLVLSIASPAFVPGIVTSDKKALLLVLSLSVGLSAGIFEELGWTGFAIPTLRQRHGVFATGLIVGICWSAWHLFPLIWAREAASGDMAMPTYLVFTIAGCLCWIPNSLQGADGVGIRADGEHPARHAHAREHHHQSANPQPFGDFRGESSDLLLCTRCSHVVGRRRYHRRNASAVASSVLSTSGLSL